MNDGSIYNNSQNIWRKDRTKQNDFTNIIISRNIRSDSQDDDIILRLCVRFRSYNFKFSEAL
jgi:hypothetical protein